MGIVFWGGVFVAIAAFLTGGPTGGQRRGARTVATAPVRGASPDPRPRDDGALVDGLIIGHVLTRDHYRPQVADLEEQLDALESRYADVWAAAGDDDGHAGEDAGPGGPLDGGFDDSFDRFGGSGDGFGDDFGDGFGDGLDDGFGDGFDDD